MNPRRDFWRRLGAAALATLVLAPVLGIFLPDTQFHRITTRLFLVAIAVAFLLRRRSAVPWRERTRAIGLDGPHRAVRFGVGAAVGGALFLLLLLGSWALGGRELQADPDHRALLERFLKACGAGLGAAVFEEIVCRGYMKNAIGGFASALLYAAAHYFRPLVGSEPPPGHYDPLLGFKRLPELFGSWTEPRHVLFGLPSLLLFGLALNRLRERTGTLYVGMGVHAAVVFGAAFYRRYFEGTPSGHEWIFGGTRLHDGLLGVATMALVLLAAHRAPLPRRLRP